MPGAKWTQRGGRVAPAGPGQAHGPGVLPVIDAWRSGPHVRGTGGRRLARRGAGWRRVCHRRSRVSCRRSPGCSPASRLHTLLPRTRQGPATAARGARLPVVRGGQGRGGLGPLCSGWWWRRLLGSAQGRVLRRGRGRPALVLRGLGRRPVGRRVACCVRGGDGLRVQRMVGSGRVRVVGGIRGVRPAFKERAGEAAVQ